MKTLKNVLNIREYQISKLISSNEDEIRKMGFKKVGENEFISTLNHEIFSSITILINASKNSNDIILENNQTSDKEQIFSLIKELYSFFHKELTFDITDLEKQSLGGKSGKTKRTDINDFLVNQKYSIGIHIYVLEFGLRISISNRIK